MGLFLTVSFAFLGYFVYSERNNPNSFKNLCANKGGVYLFDRNQARCMQKSAFIDIEAK